MSGLSPSIQNSTIFLYYTTSDMVSWFDATYGVPHRVLPVRFFGMLLTSSKLTVNDCATLIAHITARILLGRICCCLLLVGLSLSKWLCYRFKLFGLITSRYPNVFTISFK